MVPLSDDLDCLTSCHLLGLEGTIGITIGKAHQALVCDTCVVEICFALTRLGVVSLSPSVSLHIDSLCYIRLNCKLVASALRRFGVIYAFLSTGTIVIKAEEVGIEHVSGIDVNLSFSE